MAEAQCRCGHKYDSGTDDMKYPETRHVACPACGEVHLCCTLWPGWPYTAPPEPTEEQVRASKERAREFWRKREERAIAALIGPQEAVEGTW